MLGPLFLSRSMEGCAPMESKTRPFDIGDMVVYPAHGVGRIESVQKRTINGAVLDFYILKLLNTQTIVMIPTCNVCSVGLRSVIDPCEIPRIYALFRESRNTADPTSAWNKRYRDYAERIKSGSIDDIAIVFRELHRLKTAKDLSFGERKLHDLAQSLLVMELSTSRQMAEASILSEIEDIFQGKEPAAASIA